MASLDNVVPIPHVTYEFAKVIMQIKKVRANFRPGTPAYKELDQLLQNTLRRGY